MNSIRLVIQYCLDLYVPPQLFYYSVVLYGVIIIISSFIILVHPYPEHLRESKLV